MTVLKILGYIVVYIALFVAGGKFYLWSRRQQKKYKSRWQRRLGTLFFFLPVIILLVDLCLPVPEGWTSILQRATGTIDYTLAWLQTTLEPALGFGYTLLKPAISAFTYAVFGIIVGTILDFVANNR